MMHKLINGTSKICLLILLSAFLNQALAQEVDIEIQTLFTTQQERQLIDANRYRLAPKKATRTKGPVKIVKVKEVIKQEINKDFTITGITIANSGSNTAWLNGQAVLNGEKIDGKYHIHIITGKSNKIQISTPDGQNFYGTSGETVAVKYLEVVQ